MMVATVASRLHTAPQLVMRDRGSIRELRGPVLESLGHHHLHKLLVVDLAIAVDVRFPNHLINLLVGELLTQVCHDMAQLRGTDKAIAIAIENLEGLDELFLSVCVLHLP